MKDHAHSVVFDGRNILQKIQEDTTAVDFNAAEVGILGQKSDKEKYFE